MGKQFAFYLRASRPRGALYHGATGHIARRDAEHADGGEKAAKHVRKYGIYRLVYFELYPTWEEAHAREKAVKRWRREWKIDLIESLNPGWKDLGAELLNVLPMEAFQ
jgi:putative endonuclease